LKKTFFYNKILGIHEITLDKYVDNMIKILKKMNDFITKIEKQEKKNNENGKIKNSYIVREEYIQYYSDIKNKDQLTKNILNKDEIINRLFELGSSQKSETYLPYIKDEYNNFVKFFDKDIDLKQLIDNILSFINDKEKKNEIIKRINDKINEFLLNKEKEFTIYTSHEHIMNNDTYDIMPIKLEINKKLFNDLFNLYNDDLLKFMNTSNVYSTKIENVDSIDKSKFSELLKIYDHMYEIIYETHCRLNYGKEICISRLAEGNFINQSLRDLRKTIKEIMIEKNKNNIYNSPEFIDVCLDTYCPTHESCFEQKNENTIKKSIALIEVLEPYMIGDESDYLVKYL
jgi:hypothetical protein